MPAGEVAALPIAAVHDALGSRRGGLTTGEVEERRARCGPNALAHLRGRPLVRRLLAQFTHLMALLL